jgi:hypothetical protein
MNTSKQSTWKNVCVFINSTFLDMMGEWDELMTRVWQELSRFCRERQVELVEVDSWLTRITPIQETHGKAFSYLVNPIDCP